MADRITIRALLLQAVVGVWEDERTRRQDVLINVTLFTDTSDAARSDDLTDTVDYQALTDQITRLVETSRYRLVEKMADQIATLCLGDERVESVEVGVHKPQAIPAARNVGVTIERSR